MSKLILIVEDHPIVSESLERIISGSDLNIKCLHAQNASNGLAYLNGNTFDLILLDISLPDMNGVEFCKIAKSRFPSQKILAITTIAQRHVVEKMLENGADGFILKSSDVDDIIEGIRQVLNGKTLYLGKGVKDLMKGISLESSDLPMITKRESEILKLIAEGLTNHEIADQLFISTFTVDSHRKNLLLKFNAKNTATLVRIVVSKGIIDV
ncbi:MAG TPA: response regulator transcription factor [Draconibacterium sp.]|nr:response regulator transcription factor [Draconibacterium sp.]HRX11631.1 response regulator transcription factor [Draconibacterium sp.]